MRNKILNLIVVVISSFILLSFFIFSNGLDSLLSQLKKLNTNWLLAAILCMTVFWFLESFIIHIITGRLYKNGSTFAKSIKYGMVGQFFSAITPFQSGGQPAQLYYMSENGVPASSSGSILMIKFIIHQATLTIYSILVIAFKFNYFNSKIKYFIYFCFFGFLINTLIIVFAVLFSVNRKATKGILKITLKVLHKIKIVKDKDSVYEKWEKELEGFHSNSAYLAKHQSMCIFACLLTFLQWTVFYSIPYCIYRSFGFNSADIFTMIAAQVFLVMFMSCIPLPGAVGGAEGGFYMIYGIFFSKAAVVPAIFMWRIITYYSCIAVGGLFTVLLPDKNKSKMNQLRDGQ